VTGDAFTLIGELLDAFDHPAAGPFTAGLAGYLGYELKALCGGSETHESRMPDAAWIWPAEFLVLDHGTRRAFRHTLAPASARTEAADSSASARSEGDEGTAGPARAYTPGPVPEQDLALRDARTGYLDKIARAQAHITAGDSYEVCLTNAASVPAPTDALAAFVEMRRISPVPYGAYLRITPPGGRPLGILSASPETFLRVDRDGRVTTRPIKGTRPRGTTPEQDAALRLELGSSAKDRAENLMIVDLSRHDLGGVCEPGTVAVPELFAVQSFSSVHQLVSTITGRRRAGIRTLDVVRACFPPGSMTGAPKRRTMEIIDDLEGEARGPYAGALGWLDASGAAVLSVVIRTLVIDGGEASFGIGGAITALSDPADEFVETLVKASVPFHVSGGGAAAR
jgi:para-aminobenzoate synthetase